MQKAKHRSDTRGEIHVEQWKIYLFKIKQVKRSSWESTGKQLRKPKKQTKQLGLEYNRKLLI